MSTRETTVGAGSSLVGGTLKTEILREEVLELALDGFLPECELGDLPTSKALVKIVDDQGRTVAVDSRKLLGVKELQTVVSRGKAKRDEAGNLTILASGVFVRP